MNNGYFKDIGALDRFVTIRQYSARTNDRFGHQTSGTYTDTELFAALSFDYKNETDINDKQSQTQNIKVIVRPELTITLKDLALWENVIYDIINIEDIGRAKFTKLTLKRVV